MTTQITQPPSSSISASPSDPQHVRPLDLPYHRSSLANPRYRWWRPLLTLILSAFAYAGLIVATVLVVLIASFVWPALEPAVSTWSTSDTYDLDTPLGLVLGGGMLALMIPAVAIGVRLAERAPLGRLSSVAGRLRGGLLLRMLGLALLVFIPYVAIDAFVQWRHGTLDLSLTRSALLLCALTLLVVPFQAAAEEYVFRALPQQLLGAWLKNPWWGILVPIPFFVLGHTYDFYGQTNIALFALATGVLVWRTGGLEAAIALHVVNNVVVMISESVGLSEVSMHEVSAAAFWTSNVITIAFTVLAIAYHRRFVTRSDALGGQASTVGGTV